MTVVKVELEGFEKAMADLRSVGVAGDRVALLTVAQLVTKTRTHAVTGIQRGPASGRVYEKYNPRRTHQASAPGQYPMSDTGRLANGVVQLLPTEARIAGQVGTNIAYGPHLEFGTSRMAARPWLMPSLEKAKAEVLTNLRREFEKRLSQ